MGEVNSQKYYAGDDSNANPNLNPNPKDMNGRLIGQYVLEEKLGEGGMAEVWRGRHQLLGTRVAVKFLSAGLAGIPEIEQRFLGEGRRQAQLQHPNIVSAFDFLYIEDRSYLIMKFIEGQSLDDCLFRLQAPMPLAQVLAISGDVLGALQYAHSRDVIHRDVKPSNILLENGGGAFVLDFGIALVLGEQRTTRVGMAIGTPHYMSPEQIVGSRNIDCRSDIYNYGCVLYQMLTQSLPFDSADGHGDTEYIIKDKHLRQVPQPLHGFNPSVPPHIERAVMRCLEKDAGDRFGSCEELLAALKGSPVRATTIMDTPTGVGGDNVLQLPLRPRLTPRPVPVPTPLPLASPVPIAAVSVPVPIPAPAPALRGAPGQPRQGSSLLWIVTGAVLALAVTGGGFYWYTNRQRAESPVASGPPPSTSRTTPLADSPAAGGPVLPKPTAGTKAQPNPPAPQPANTEEVEAAEPPRPQPADKPAEQSTRQAPKQTSVPTDLSGNWSGEYTRLGTNQAAKVSLRIHEDGLGLLTGILKFDPGGSNAANCPITGNYSRATKFMLLIVASCQGHPPDSLEGTIGFSAVQPTNRQVRGLDSKQRGMFEINR